MKKLLTFKHWQLFLLIFIFGAWTSPSPLREIINSIAVVTFTFWFYAIGVYGQDQISELGLKPMNLNLFKANTIIVGTFFLIGLLYSAIQGEVNQEATESFGAEQIIYTVAAIYLVFAIVHTIIFACKTISKLENRREVIFGDYLNNIMLIFFFFAGIWFLQPKVNRLIARKKEVAF